MRPRVAIDLFAGCGGLTQGLGDAGIDVRAAVEINELAASTYRMNHPQVELLEDDIRQVTADQVLAKVRRKVGNVFLVAGCPPCQGFSSIRTRNGKSAEDERNDLVEDFGRIVVGVRPKFAMMENVPGLAKDDRLERLSARLRRNGYSVASQVFDVADFGVPQRRRRLVLIASRDGKALLPSPSDMRTTVREAIGDMPPPSKSKDAIHTFPEKRSERVAAVIRAIPKDGGSRRSLPVSLQLDCHKKSDGFKDVYGRMAWDSQAPTMTCGCVNPSKGRFLHPEQNRAITPREAALLQTFPADYQFSTEGGKYGVARMVGNALPPRFVAKVVESALV